jgi:hypothetical protein
LVYRRSKKKKKQTERKMARETKSINNLDKDLWYNFPEITRAKYCRCILESSAGDLYRHKEIKINPYAVCNSSISRDDVSSSDLAKFSLSGECGKHASYKNIPTDLLYAYIRLKMKNRPRDIAKYFSLVPTLDQFLSSKESYRQLLLKIIENYESK